MIVFRNMTQWWKRWRKHILLIILGVLGALVITHVIDTFLQASSNPSRRLTMLHKAAAFGSPTLVRGLLLWGHDVNIRETLKQSTPLHWAACKGHHEVVRLLLSKGAAINVRDHYGATPLHYASAAGRTAIVKELLDHGGELDASTGYGQTPLFYAVDDGYYYIYELWYPSRMYYEPLLHLPKSTELSNDHPQISATDKYNTVQFLLSQGADLHLADNSDNTVLHAAARGGNPDIVALLLSKGLDVNARNARRDALSLVTPLHYAALYCHAEVIELLLAHGADVHAQDADGNTPLQFVKEYCTDNEKQDVMLEVLHTYGANE